VCQEAGLRYLYTKKRLTRFAIISATCSCTRAHADRYWGVRVWRQWHRITAAEPFRVRSVAALQRDARNYSAFQQSVPWARVGNGSLPTVASSNRFQRTRSWNYGWRMEVITLHNNSHTFSAAKEKLSLFSNKHDAREMYEVVEMHLYKTYPRHLRVECVCLFQKNLLCLNTVNSY
jgi:hypothetical protein